MITGIFIFSVIVLSILCYFFFAPFYLEINTTKGLYRIRFHKLASIRFRMTNNTFFLDIKIARWTKQLDLLADHSSSKHKSRLKKKKIKSQQTFIPWGRIQNVLASFRMDTCDISIDTGNMQLNGILYPLLYLLKMKTGKNIGINFIDENKIIIEIQNSLARMSWAYISSPY